MALCKLWTVEVASSLVIVGDQSLSPHVWARSFEACSFGGSKSASLRIRRIHNRSCRLWKVANLPDTTCAHSAHLQVVSRSQTATSPPFYMMTSSVGEVIEGRGWLRKTNLQEAEESHCVGSGRLNDRQLLSMQLHACRTIVNLSLPPIQYVRREVTINTITY